MQGVKFMGIAQHAGPAVQHYHLLHVYAGNARQIWDAVSSQSMIYVIGLV
jgi:hypothetical protein